jgi:hypothetical protein
MPKYSSNKTEKITSLICNKCHFQTTKKRESLLKKGKNNKDVSIKIRKYAGLLSH